VGGAGDVGGVGGIGCMSVGEDERDGWVGWSVRWRGRETPNCYIVVHLLYCIDVNTEPLGLEKEKTMTVYNNPIVLQRADPWVLKVDGEYWFTASDPEYDKIAIRHASTINDLQKAPETVVWRKHESGVCSKYIWILIAYTDRDTALII